MNDTKHTNQTFEYNYSAKQQDELESIRRKYAPVEYSQDKLVLLRRMDAQTTQKGTMVALIVGIVGALIFGLGMSCVMVWMGPWFVPGILIGIVGIAGIITAYPLYNHVVKKEREKMSPQILKLIDELSER